VFLLLLGLCGPGGADGPLAGAGKITFDLSLLDATGLYGPADGRRALHYEFCIPDRAQAAAQVRALDASLRLQRARGRIGCSGAELLCVGSTHQRGYREVLAGLARLPFVERIEQAFFE
jgi:hypothetical protein